MKKSTFFDYLNRRVDMDFATLLEQGVEDQDYIVWNDFAAQPLRKCGARVQCNSQ